MPTMRIKQARGMTLIEMLVSMVVLTILGASIAAIMVAQLKNSASIQGQSMVQSDVNLALSMIRADINQAGFGNATGDTAASSTAPAGADNMTLMGSNIGAGAGRWTIVDTGNTYGAANHLTVHRWTGVDAVNDIQITDSIKVMSGLKELIGTATVTGRVASGASEWDLTINQNLATGTGAMVTQINTNVIGTGTAGGQVVYTLNTATRQLQRNGLVFLDNVEDFHVRYFWDRNGDGTIDSLGGETDDVLTMFVNPGLWNTRPVLIGVSFVTVSPSQENKVVDSRASYTIWGRTFTITAPLSRHYRNFYSLYARPRDIGG